VPKKYLVCKGGDIEFRTFFMKVRGMVLIRKVWMSYGEWLLDGLRCHLHCGQGVAQEASQCEFVLYSKHDL